VNGQLQSRDSRLTRQRLVWRVSLAAILSIVGNDIIAGTMCSSLDGQKYCSCEYNQKCSSMENSCSCIPYDSQTPVPVFRSQPPKNLDRATEPSSDHRPPQELSGHRDSKPSPPVDDNRKDERPPHELTISHGAKPSPPVDDGRIGTSSGVQFQPPRSEISPDPKPPAEDERTARDYVRLAQTAITKGKIADAVELIEKGQTRLLDRSVSLNRTFDPITDESVQNLSAAKRALLTKDRATALGALDSALAAIK
jgi:hypothetical protein